MKLLPKRPLVAGPNTRRSWSSCVNGGAEEEDEEEEDDEEDEEDEELDRVVVDRTGLSGFYSITLEWSSEGPSIFTAIQEQLGLKLVARNEPIEFLIVESAEKPTSVRGSRRHTAGSRNKLVSTPKALEYANARGHLISLQMGEHLDFSQPRLA